MREAPSTQRPMRRLRSAIAAAATGALLAGAGCSGARAELPLLEPSAEAQITTALETYVEAKARGDGELACAQLTQKRQMGELGTGGDTPCPAAIKKLARILPPDADQVEVQSVRLDGDQATAIAEFPRETDEVYFERIDGTWKIDGFHELSSKPAGP